MKTKLLRKIRKRFSWTYDYTYPNYPNAGRRWTILDHRIQIVYYAANIDDALRCIVLIVLGEAAWLKHINVSHKRSCRQNYYRAQKCIKEAAV